MGAMFGQAKDICKWAITCWNVHRLESQQTFYGSGVDWNHWSFFGDEMTQIRESISKTLRAHCRMSPVVQQRKGSLFV